MPPRGGGVPIPSLRAFLPVILLLAPLASAEADADQHIYFEAQGCLALGLVATSAERVSQVSFDLTPVDGFHRLRFALGFAPEGLALDTPAAEAIVRYRLQLDVLDAATGASLASYRYDMPGLRVLEVEDEAPLVVRLTLLQGAAVEYSLRVNALPDAEPVE